jgi:D-arabinan exo alpha-(1,3)/(1,5)-arabinofuranosidase (non-reducing end)
MRLCSLALPSALLATAAAAFAQGVASPTLELARIQPGAKSKRVSSYDVTGGNADNVSKIAPGTRRDLFDVKGAGIITHIWVTIAPPPPALSRHDVILRMYWDGETAPSVEAPIGDFFGQGWE